MAGFIVLSDGRAYSPNNWGFDTTIDAIVRAMPDTQDGQTLADWLLDQKCSVRGAGMGCVDIRELTQENQELFLKAVQDAYRTEKEKGPTGWFSPDFWPSWIRGFYDLVKMIECVKHREPPADFNPYMTDVIPPTGWKSGPGWDVVK